MFLGLPLAIACFFLVILVIFICVLLFEFRRNRLRRMQGDRFDEDDQNYAEEVAETYMRLLEPVVFAKSQCKYLDCSICLKEFDEGETLQRIPNCQHIFHEACLRKWFVQA